MEPVSEIEALVANGSRGPGTDAERRAARRLERRLIAMGREARLEPIEVHPRWELAHLIHALAAIGGSLLSVSHPLPATIVLLVAALSAFGDVTGSFHLARRITGRRASQNVVSREDGDLPGTLVLVAHYDAARTGAAFGSWLTERRAALGALIHRPIGGLEPFFWSMLALLVCSALRLAGVDPLAVTVVQFAATVVMIVSVPFLVGIALAPLVPGANDNASGVVTVLRLAERYGGDLDHFDVWVLLPGAGEGLELGMRAWLRAHRRELDRGRTVFLCVDQVGHGTVRYARREGYAIPFSMNRALIDLCEQIAEEDAAADDRYRARSYVARSASDAYTARLAGYPAVCVSCLGALDYARHHHLPTDTVENLDPAALDRAFGFCSELVELIDERLGPELEPGDAAAGW